MSRPRTRTSGPDPALRARIWNLWGCNAAAFKRLGFQWDTPDPRSDRTRRPVTNERGALTLEPVEPNDVGVVRVSEGDFGRFMAPLPVRPEVAEAIKRRFHAYLWAWDLGMLSDHDSDEFHWLACFTTADIRRLYFSGDRDSDRFQNALAAATAKKERFLADREAAGLTGDGKLRNPWADE